jgi:hypothetical protein
MPQPAGWPLSGGDGHAAALFDFEQSIEVVRRHGFLEPVDVQRLERASNAQGGGDIEAMAFDWARDARGGSAQVDYLAVRGAKILTEFGQTFHSFPLSVSQPFHQQLDAMVNFLTFYII